jgi:hypothetical protein
LVTLLFFKKKPHTRRTKHKTLLRQKKEFGAAAAYSHYGVRVLGLLLAIVQRHCQHWLTAIAKI